MLQSIDRENLSNKEGLRVHSKIFLRKGNKRDFVGGLEVGGHEHRRDQLDLVGKVEEINTGRNVWN